MGRWVVGYSQILGDAIVLLWRRNQVWVTSVSSSKTAEVDGGGSASP
jgi:hypothetical protein